MARAYKLNTGDGLCTLHIGCLFLCYRIRFPGNIRYHETTPQFGSLVVTIDIRTS